MELVYIQLLESWSWRFESSRGHHLDRGIDNMNLAEALIERADIQKQLAQMPGRLMDSLVVQEGEDPSESPSDLFRENDELCNRLEELVGAINRTNSQETVSIDGQEYTISDALALRDVTMNRINLVRVAVDHGTVRSNRYSSSEIRNVSTVDVKGLRKILDDLSVGYRIIDTAIQQANWNTEVLFS